MTVNTHMNTLLTYIDTCVDIYMYVNKGYALFLIAFFTWSSVYFLS